MDDPAAVIDRLEKLTEPTFLAFLVQILAQPSY
jgi:hypothetical protein